MRHVLHGVAIKYKNKYWGILYNDGYSSESGWTDDPKSIRISDPKYCKKPTDVTYEGSPDKEELRKGKLVKVCRVLTVEEVL